jgi:type II secretory pathway pseudopilin PulG
MKAIRKTSGFSLIELLVTLTLLILVMGSVYSLFASNQKAYAVQDQVLERDQMLLACNELLGREARSAGLKVALNGAGKLGPVALMFSAGYLPSSPAPLTVSLSASDPPLKITPGSGTNPDAVTIIGAMGDKTNVTKVSNDPGIGDTAITLNLTALQTQALYSAGDVIYIGEEVENAKITAVNGNQLTIDTDPSLSGNQGLTRNHAQWAEVGKLSVISYEIFTVGGVKSLQRKENAGSFEAVGENFVDFQATQTGVNTTIVFTGQTAHPDSSYSPTSGYRQKVVSINVAPKNIK